jgi:hypothetical protein
MGLGELCAARANGQERRWAAAGGRRLLPVVLPVYRDLRLARWEKKGQAAAAGCCCACVCVR